MNCETCQLKELEVEPLEIRDVLRCILHTIVFHRALGLVHPKDVECELFEITYPFFVASRIKGCGHKKLYKIHAGLVVMGCHKVQCGDTDIEKKIDEKIDHFISWVEKHPNKKSQVCLSFYEVKNKQATWFPSKPERLYWEQWFINLHVLNPKIHRSQSSKAPLGAGDAIQESGSRRATLETSLREVLFRVIKFVNEKKDHIPSIPNSDIISFPYEITTPSSSDSSFGWHTDVLKRMLLTGHPSMLS